MINAVIDLSGWCGPTVHGLVNVTTAGANLGLLSLPTAPADSAIVLVLAGHDGR
jgi:hypothetical protein